MYNIKIKSVPNKAKTGSQLDYSLVDRNTLFLKPDTQVQSDVKNTISAVPREEANIEAEGGETIIGDTNNDGFLEHQTIVGKRHSKGGVPLNVPEGSFIFSDTDKLRIKDPEILKMFGMAPNKKGYTPAEIAKKYQVNDYMAILKDETKDKYSKETAQVMLDSNLKKLGMLALVQESMKGFPDGVPAIAESVMEGMMGGGAPEQQEEEQQGQPEARYGGLTQLPKAQIGINWTVASSGPTTSKTPATSTVNNESTPEDPNAVSNPGNPIPLNEVAVTSKRLNAIPKLGDTYYVDGQPIKVSDIEESSVGDWLPNWLNDPQGVYFSPAGTTDYDSKNKKYYLTFDEFKKLRDTTDPNTVPVLTKQGRTASSWWTADDNRAYNFSARPTAQPTRKYGKYKFDQNDILELPTGKYKVIDTQYGVGEKNPLLAPERFLGMPADLYNEKIRAKNLTTGQIEELRLDELEAKLDANFAKNLTKYPEAATTNPDGTPATGEWTVTGNDGTTTNSMGVDEQVKSKEVGKPKPVMPVIAPKVKKQGSALKTDSASSSFIIDTSNEEQPQQAYGGSIYKMQVGGGTPRFNSATGMYQNYDANGKPIGAQYKGTGTTYNVRDKDVLEKAKAANYEVIGNKYAPNVTYISEQTSKTGFAPGVESGIYENKQFPIGKQGLDELVNIWKDELSNYEGPSGKGVEAWKTDILKAKGKPSAASKFYALEANKSSNAAGLGDQIDTNVEDWDVPGQEWFSTKKFKKAAPAQVAQTTTPSIERGAPDIMQQAITPTIGRKTRGWFTPDMLNLANAFGRKIGNFPPTLRQVNFQTGPYNLLSPEGEIAKIQSTGNMLSNQAANTMAGNVGFNAAVGAQGQTIDAVTNTQGKYSNANVGTSNEASRFGAGVFNQGQLSNAELLSAFDRDNAIYGQQRVNSLNRKDDAITRAYNQAWGNAFKGNMLEDMFPQVGIDRVYGDIGYSGVGRDYHTYDTYINPLTSNLGTKGARANQYADFDEASLDEYEQIFNAALPRMGKENAQKYALQFISRKSRNNTYDPYNPAQAVSEGLGQMF